MKNIPEGATHISLGGSYRRLVGRIWYGYADGDWVPVAWNYGQNHTPIMASGDALKSERVVEWDGKGLPPVGLECEFKSVGHHDDPEYQWCIYHGKMSCGGYIIEYHHYTSADMVTCAPFDPAFTTFRPILTPKQIVADEREQKIRNACTEISKTLDRFNNDIPGGSAALSVIEAMIDAGYAKQVGK